MTRRIGPRHGQTLLIDGLLPLAALPRRVHDLATPGQAVLVTLRARRHDLLRLGGVLADLGAMPRERGDWGDQPARRSGWAATAAHPRNRTRIAPATADQPPDVVRHRRGPLSPRGARARPASRSAPPVRDPRRGPSGKDPRRRMQQVAILTLVALDVHRNGRRRGRRARRRGGGRRGCGPDVCAGRAVRRGRADPTLESTAAGAGDGATGTTRVATDRRAPSARRAGAKRGTFGSAGRRTPAPRRSSGRRRRASPSERRAADARERRRLLSEHRLPGARSGSLRPCLRRPTRRALTAG